MSEPLSDSMRIRVVARSRVLPGFEGSVPFAAGYVEEPAGRAPARPVLIPGDAQEGTTIDVAADRVIRLKTALSPAHALLVAPLAMAMSFWDRLGLELGDAAVYTEGGPLSRLTGQVALWRGACPVVELSPADAVPLPGVIHVDWSDVEEAAKHLTTATEPRPGFAAVELSGRAEMLDTLLESMPRWSRLLLASEAGGPVTIDYYKNVHRKGAIIDATVGETATLFDPALGAAARAHVDRATQWLAKPVQAAQCLAALGLQPAVAP